jgi:alkylmercury lyase
MATDIESLADAIDRARPHLTETDQQVWLALYRLLGEGVPVSPAQLAAATEVTEGEIEARLQKWPGVYRDDAGFIVGFWGLTVMEMPPHEILLEGRKLWAWCAWDTLFLPGRLGATLDVESRCPTTGGKISLRVAPQGVISVEPREAVVSILEPSGPFDADVIASFCHFVHFFVDAQAGEKWTSEHPGTFLISLEEAFELGRLTNDALLRAEPRRSPSQ